MKNIFKLKFKKITFLDLFIFLALLSLFIFLFIRLFRKSEFLDIVLKIYRDEWFIEKLKPGIKEKNIMGQTMAELINIKTYPTSDQKKWAHLRIKLKAVYNPGDNSYTYKNKKILIGNNLEFYMNNLLIDGTVLKINDKKNKNQFKIYAKGQIIDINPAFPNTEGVSEYLANSIKEHEIMKDSLGSPVIEIKKKEVFDAKMVTVDQYGNTKISVNPLRKDVYLDLIIYADKIGQYYYLFGDENFPIIIGNGIPFTTKNNWVFFTITNIEKIENNK